MPVYSSRLCTIQSENMVMKSEHTQAVSQLTAQNEALRNSFRDQVRHLQEEHRKTVETLQQQLSKVEAQLFQLKSEPSSKSKLLSIICQRYEIQWRMSEKCSRMSECQLRFPILSLQGSPDSDFKMMFDDSIPLKEQDPVLWCGVPISPSRIRLWVLWRIQGCKGRKVPINRMLH